MSTVNGTEEAKNMFIHVTRHENDRPGAPICIHFSQHIGAGAAGIRTEIQLSLEEAHTLSIELAEFEQLIREYQYGLS